MNATDPLAEAALFDVEMPPPVSLADKFGVPPFSVLDRRSGLWQERKRKWMQLGFRSEVGRGENLTYTTGPEGSPDRSGFREKMSGIGGTSVFDPVTCELVTRWYSAQGDRILDPFCGGSVRGLVASTLARWYTGIEVRPEQVESNQAQAHLGSDIAPQWLVGDATRLEDTLDDDGYDLLFTCPPYGDLEVYSDHPRDISSWTYDQFLEGQQAAINGATERLNDNRFACWVTSDIRDKKGAYRGLVSDTIQQFKAAGLTLHNEAIILDMVGSFAIRAERPFRSSRKLVRAHQVLLVFCKGDPKKATKRMAEQEQAAQEGAA